MGPEFIGAIGVGGVMAGVAGAKAFSMLTKARKTNGYHHCKDHPMMAQTLTEVKQDVKWLREKQESDANNKLLDGILDHLVKQSKK